MPETQLSALVGFLETIVVPGIEGEQINAKEAQAVLRSKEWFKHNQGLLFEDVVSDLGFTMEQIGGHKEPG